MSGVILTIENYLLEELVAVFKYQSLSKAAASLHLTQPTLSRGMQKLEQTLGVELFERQANKVTLNQTGLLAAKEAQKLLSANQKFLTTIQNFAQANEQLTIGATIPGPLLLLESLGQSNLKLPTSLLANQDIADTLSNHQVELIFSSKEIITNQIESIYLGREQLFVRLDNFHPLASLRTLSFSQLNSLSFLVANDIGVWKDIIQNEIPQAHFLYQQDLAALSELTHYTNFPIFRTNLSNLKDFDKDDGRTLLPLRDEAAGLEVYANYLKVNQPKVKDLIKQIQDSWPN